MIPVIVKTPMGDVAFETRPNAAMMLLFDADGRPSAMKADISDMRVAIAIAKQSFENLKAAQLAVTQAKEKPTDEVHEETTPAVDASSGD